MLPKKNNPKIVPKKNNPKVVPKKEKIPKEECFYHRVSDLSECESSVSSPIHSSDSEKEFKYEVRE